jgi:hypothetical protein
MSTLLEQAIVDAAALKDAALKNAEQAIIEKYAPEIKEAVDSLLEAEGDLGLGGDEDPLADLGGLGGEEDPLAADAPPAATPDAPLAATDGEKLCACPEEDEVVEINFDQLVQQMEDEEASTETSQEDLAAGIGGPPPGEAPTGMGALGEEIEIDEDKLKEILFETSADSDEIEISEDLISAIAAELSEELTIDIGVDSGTGLGGGTTPSARREDAIEVDKALAAQEVEDQRKESEEKEEKLNEKIESLSESNTKLKKTVHALKTHVNEVNLSNAKLLYINRVLNSDSLNERQRSKIVDAISQAGSVEEAKTIFETLQSTMGNSAKRRQPQSLSEAVSRSGSSVLPRRQPKTKSVDPTITRMRKLAGLG